MGLFNKKKVETAQSDISIREAASPLAGVMPPARDIYPDIDADTAMSISTVYRAIQIITTAVMQMKIAVFRGGEKIETPLLIRQPDPSMPLSRFLKQTAFSLVTKGNAYWRIYTNDAGDVQVLKVLNPGAVWIEKDDNGNIYYNYMDLTGPQKFTQYEIAHLRLTEMFDYMGYGVGPIQLAKKELRGFLTLRDYADVVFNPATLPSGILSYQYELSDDTIKKTLDGWVEMIKHGHGIGMLTQGMTFQNTIISPEDAQFIEVQRLRTADVARLFGIPSSKLLVAQQGASKTYQNLQDEDSDFIRYTLQQYLVTIEDALSTLLPRGQEVRLDTSALLRGNTGQRYAYYKTGIDAGFLLPSEARREESLPEIEGIDDRKPAPETDAGNEGDPTEQ